MDRSTLRIVLFAALGLLAYWFFVGRKSSDHVQQLPPETYVSAPGFAPDVIDVEPGQTAPPPAAGGEICKIHGSRFEAEMTSHGAGLTHFRLTDAQYRQTDDDDMSTTPDIERWHNLRTEFRTNPGAPATAADQVQFDRFDWKLSSIDGGCRFTYEDDRVRIVKSVTAGARPFELDLQTQLTNLSDSPKTHATSVELFAFRTNKKVKSNFGRVSPFQTDLECARDSDIKRKGKDDDAFKDPSKNPTDPFWFEEPLVDRYAAITNYYFAQTLIPMEAAPGAPPGIEKPACDLLAEQWYGANQKPDDEDAGDVYHAKLAYPKRTLGSNESATYKEIAFFGPKERDVLAVAAGGWPRLGDLINLGTFSVVAKVLVAIIAWIHAHITMGNWGLAIVVLTVALRITLFPLTWKQIQNTIAMRKLKPETDALNAKFKDDPQAKNLAMMELWRKHKVNPLGGCVPQLVQMPIWFALYATLQTAVEFYHTSFLWFSDLSAPDRFYILPFVLGGASIVQQRIVPMQGVDPVQQKMMTWLMPLIFTGMMLFLPAALGVYMLTNSVLGITQQLGVEKLASRHGVGRLTSPAAGEIAVKKVDGNKSADGKGPPAALRKGKARV